MLAAALLLPLLPLAAMSTPAHADHVTLSVVPSAWTTTGAPTGNSFPFGTCSSSFRYQQVYAGASAGSGAISTIAFRPDGSAAWTAGVVADVTIKLATTTRSVNGLSTTFADNLGADASEVFTGAVTPASAADVFGFAIPFDRAFTFDHTAGNLLVDATVTFRSCAGLRFLDASQDSGDAVSRLFATSATALTGRTDTTGLVTQFGFAHPAVTVTADDQTVTFGDADPTFTATPTSQTGSTLTGAPTCGVEGAHTAAGTYPITCSGATAADGVSIEYVAGTLTVKRAPVSIAANNATISVDDETPAIGHTVSGLLGEDALITAPTCALSGERAGVGTYVTSCSGADAGDNYALTYVDGTLTVEQGAQTIAFTSTPPAEPTFGGTYTVTAEGGASGQPVVFTLDAATTADACTIQDGVVTFVHAGSCVVNADQAGTADYTAAVTAQQVLTIPAEATTTALTVRADTISAVVSPVRSAVTPTGTVHFSVNGEPVGFAELSEGTATLAYAVPTSKAGNVAAVYAGSTDFTGSSASTTRTNPTIVAQLSSTRATTRFGWYSTPVTVRFTCEAGSAQLTNPCPAPVTLSRSAAGQRVFRSITTLDGGVASVAVSGINIDRTAPSVRVLGVRPGATYRGEAPKPRCAGADALSGVASCTVRVTRRNNVVSYVATATDRAGLKRSISGQYQHLSTWIHGAPYHPSTGFSVRAGKHVIYSSSAARPIYRWAAPVGTTQPAGGDTAFNPAGPRLWKLTVTITPQMYKRYHAWNLGVKIGSTPHLVRITLV